MNCTIIVPKVAEYIHDVSHGIPIVIKHALGQIYEFNVPITDVVAELQSENKMTIP